MLRRALILALASLTLALSTGCGSTLVPFTRDLRDQSGLTPADLKNLQYYMSRRVTLRRELTSDSREVTGAHQLVIVSGKRVEEVVIEEHTPGVAVAVDARSLTVSFEPGSAMTFTPEGEGFTVDARRGFAETPEPFPGNDGTTSSPTPNPFPSSLSPGHYALVTEASRTILYQGKRFDVVGESQAAELLIDARSLERVSTSRKIAPGMKLSDTAR